MNLFKKDEKPLLAPDVAIPWASGAIFNPGACFDGEVVHLLFRAIPAGYRRVHLAQAEEGESGIGFDDYVSYIGHAVSRDGARFEVMPEPLIVPEAPIDAFGAEDPRVTALEGTYWITYSALQSPAFDPGARVRIGLASTTDFTTARKYGVVGPPERDKDAVLFPQLIGGRAAMLHRIVPDIQIIYFDDLGMLMNPPASLWERHLATLGDHIVMRPHEPWEVRKIGAGPPPIRTDEGWLLIYHGVDERHVYRGGMALLDLDDPARVVARARRPVLEPEFVFEREGDVDNVVFPEGAVVLDGVLHVYYGAADRVIGHATAPLSDVLAMLREEALHASESRVASIETPPPVAPRRMHGGRPVLEPVARHSWESRVVLNPAAVLVEPGERLTAFGSACGLSAQNLAHLEDAGGACVMLYRAQGDVDPRLGVAPSSLGLAAFTPDLHLVVRMDEPVIRPDASYQDLGVEDPRCTCVDGEYLLYYTGYGQEASGDGRVRICLARSRDLVHWLMEGPIKGDLNAYPNKNAALLPEPVGDRWVLLHRPMEGPGAMAIHWAESTGPRGPWYARGLLMESHRYREFSRSWIGAGGPPLSLGGGRFLMIYHQGHYTHDGRREYDLAAALLDFSYDNPVRARIEPLMRPTGALEQTGDAALGVDNVLFTCANYQYGNEIVVPYAGADSRIFGASIGLRSLREALEGAILE